MSKERNHSRTLRQEYLDYVEGLRDTAPSLDALTDDDRRTVERWIASLNTARGIDPYASRPSTADLIARSQAARHAADADTIEQALQAGLLQSVDAGAVVVPDAASVAGGLASRLVLHARGMRLRVIIEPTGTDIDATYGNRVAEIAAVFGAFPDTTAVLVTTPGPNISGMVVDRDDVVSAIETPSGRHRPPRIRRPITDPVVACTQFIAETIPVFESFDYVAAFTASATARMVDVEHVAATAVADVITAGQRARLEAKRTTWSGLAARETSELAALLHDAMHGELNDDEYRRRLDDLVGAA